MRLCGARCARRSGRGASEEDEAGRAVALSRVGLEELQHELVGAVAAAGEGVADLHGQVEVSEGESVWYAEGALQSLRRGLRADPGDQLKAGRGVVQGHGGGFLQARGVVAGAQGRAGSGVVVTPGAVPFPGRIIRQTCGGGTTHIPSGAGPGGCSP